MTVATPEETRPSKEAARVRCPTCRFDNEPASDFCWACGLHFETMTKAVGPWEFSFSEVKFAYEPSGKTDFRSATMMLAVGVATAIAVGSVLPFGHFYARKLAGFIGEYSSLMMLAVALILPPLLSVGAGVLVGLAIGRVAVARKSLDTSAAQTIGFVSALVGCVVFLFARIIVLNQIFATGEALDHWMDFLKIGLAIVFFIGATVMFSKDQIEGEPFCKNCNEYMNGPVSWRSFSLTVEQAVMAALQGGKHKRVLELAAQPVPTQDNCCSIDLWYCQECRGTGFMNLVSCRTRLVKEHGSKEPSESTFRRRISSLAVDKTALETYLENLPESE